MYSRVVLVHELNPNRLFRSHLIPAIFEVFYKVLSALGLRGLSYSAPLHWSATADNDINTHVELAVFAIILIETSDELSDLIAILSSSKHHFKSPLM
jgi:hypothetical protein